MKPCDSPGRGNMLHMRPLRDEYHGRNACNDAEPCPTLRNRVHRMSLPTPLHAHTWAAVQTGRLSRLSPDLVGALHGDAVEVCARAARPAWETGDTRHDGLQSLREMGR